MISLKKDLIVHFLNAIPHEVFLIIHFSLDLLFHLVVIVLKARLSSSSVPFAELSPRGTQNLSSKYVTIYLKCDIVQ
ncbi:hypothetical protein PRIPAC_78944 [Pristionchus pacificus]|uniref:Uncharacterized protein n=1 Tax=Pristionchus pacificus TaxID=54126 RepID=A0A2A6CMF0_PRIPA|nr:hypothetical protein PRIPAC_78944 [Pristionchus pacificus]|eukprot:PDM79270.1 hypothetical protein PRIPAC_31849 [Pristionchus pacificus]